MKARIRKILSIVILIICGIFITQVISWIKFLERPLVPSDQTIDYVLPPGASIKTLANDLHTLGFLKKPYYLIWLARFTGHTQNLQAGEYLFPAGIKPLNLLQQIVAGKVIYHNLTIVEGWTFKQVMDAVNNDPHLEHTLKGLTPGQIMDKLGYPDENPEGRFYPDTYRFNNGMTDVTFLQRAYRAMHDRLTEEWHNRDPDLPYLTPYDALIAASLIEKETALLFERPMVAGVLLKRLRTNMYLQIDSTVIYGLGSFYNGKLNKAGLRMDTPYNTYLHKGLPPTPIAMPSRQSLNAALHPLTGSALYFVSKGDGSHQFSATLKEHENAVAKYIQILRKRVTITAIARIKKPIINIFNFKVTMAPICSAPWYIGMALQSLLFNRCHMEDKNKSHNSEFLMQRK